jgi:hypothetical protein
MRQRQNRPLKVIHDKGLPLVNGRVPAYKAQDLEFKLQHKSINQSINQSMLHVVSLFPSISLKGSFS